MTEQELIEAAAHVRENAYAPYSQFKVGAALLTTSGDMFVGCNVENSSYGLTVCAERNAIAAMIAAGQTKFEKIVVAASPLASPCGACRQAIVEFGADTEVISFDPADPKQIKRWRASELITDHFRFNR